MIAKLIKYTFIISLVDLLTCLSNSKSNNILFKFSENYPFLINSDIGKDFVFFPANSGYIVTKKWDDPILAHSYRDKNILIPVTAGKNLYSCHANFGYNLTNTRMVSLLRVTVT